MSASPALPSSYETLRLVIDGAVATLTLARPERLNAAPPQMFTELGDALSRLTGLGARALVITGEGRAFCSGADLSGRTESAAATARGARAFQALTECYGPTMQALARLPLPVVAAVNGPAAGIGCSLALACDFVLAGRSAYFLEAFVNIGLVPDGGATWMLPRLVGKARATAMMMLGERIGADQAESWGLIWKAVDDAELMPQAQALAARLAAGPTRALGLMRQGLARALEQNYAEAMATEASHQMIAADSADAREGAAAFLERRKAQFKGL
ncbi:MAG: enoyl-CoA hydratase-related protein [Rubrivivax sp.]